MTGNNLNSTHGFTLVELMVSMVLGLVISAAAVNIYLESRYSYQQDEELARLQENGRFSLNYLKRELTLSGFLGGIRDKENLGVSAVTTDCGDGTNWALDASVPFDLLSDNDGATDLTSINGIEWNCITPTELESGSDVFSIKRTSDAPTLRNGNLQSDGEDLEQWYLRIFNYNQYNWSYINTAIPTDDATADSGVDYWEYYAKIFYLRNYAVTSSDGIPTLCVRTLIGDDFSEQCLVEGIEDLQIEVGVDRDDNGTVEQYLNTPAAADFDDIRAVRLYLLVRSINEIPGYTNNKSYRLGQTVIPAFNDGFIRRVFSTTIKLRNSGFS